MALRVQLGNRFGAINGAFHHNCDKAIFSRPFSVSSMSCISLHTKFPTAYAVGVASFEVSSTFFSNNGYTPQIPSKFSSVSRRQHLGISKPSFVVFCSSHPTQNLNKEKLEGDKVRVRFAPSPTGNLHVGGARTALFNWLFARSLGGKFILRIEDTDLERSTRESEEAMLRDLRWLGMNWDEGPDAPGEFGPYRQSERNEIYQIYAKKLLASGCVYRCFCTDEELEAMRKEQEEKKLPPKYTGKWAHATEEEINQALDEGRPFTYRFRVPQDKRIAIDDLIRGEVAWNTDTLGDFVILRSNGQPVYNFCVAVDDATMKISHVIRAEEHLPNTLRQALIYEALDFAMPQFGHVSLILAPDRSKLSKRHGATSVGQFKEMGILPEAMINYLSLLGWNDGTEEELFTTDRLFEKFSIDRITKSAAIFDKTKLEWMNGQYLKRKSEDEIRSLLSQEWLSSGILTSSSDDDFIQDAVELVKNGINIVTECNQSLINLFTYPLLKTIQSSEARPFIEDGIEEFSKALVSAFDDGSLEASIHGGHDTWQQFIKALGKAHKRKGKRLFMPARILLTGNMQGPDVGSTLLMLSKAKKSSDTVSPNTPFVSLEERVKILREVDWPEVISSLPASSDVPVTVSH